MLRTPVIGKRVVRLSQQWIPLYFCEDGWYASVSVKGQKSRCHESRNDVVEGGMGVSRIEMLSHAQPVIQLDKDGAEYRHSAAAPFVWYALRSDPQNRRSRLTGSTVFDLPEELLHTLELKAQLNTTHDTTSEGLPSSENKEGVERLETTEDAPTSAATAAACALCNLNFSSVEEQRSHVRSDQHGYNLKQRIRGLKPVDEKDFDRLVGGERCIPYTIDRSERVKLTGYLTRQNWTRASLAPTRPTVRAAQKTTNAKIPR